MTYSPSVSVTTLCAQAYDEAHAYHGDLDLSLPPYVRRLTDISNHHLPSPTTPAAVVAFLTSLHTIDLYLAVACGQQSETAWLRFSRLYREYLRDVTRRVCSLRSLADEIADAAMGHVCLPDASGRSRIAAFDGRSSLGFWLAVIVKRLAIRERQRQCNRAEGLTEHLDLVDRQSVERMEAHVRRARYQGLIRDCLAEMASGLSERELLILRLRYQRGLKASEIAGLLEVHRSSVTRQLERTHARLKEAFLAGLAAQQPLSPAAVEECLAEMIEDPEYAAFALSTLG